LDIKLQRIFESKLEEGTGGLHKRKFYNLYSSTCKLLLRQDELGVRNQKRTKYLSENLTGKYHLRDVDARMLLE
jgi:hypothetical protein